MAADAMEMVLEQEKVAPRREELASVHEVLLSMTRTSKGLRIYLPNNPMLVKFVEDLTSLLALHMARFGDLMLEVERFSLTYQGVEVYQNSEAKESIAFRLYSDGIRALLFRQGIRSRELIQFLQAVRFDRPSGSDDDIVTRLWEEDLPHIDYLLDDDLVEVDWAEDQLLSQQEAVSRVYSFIEQNSPLPPRVVSKHLLMLTGDEAKWLRQAVKSEELRDPLEDVVAILRCILAGTADPPLFADFAGIAAKLATDLFLAGQVGRALELVRFLNQVAQQEGIAPELRQQVRDLLAGILSEQTVPVLQKTLDSGDSVSYDQLRELLLIFAVPSLGAIAELLGRVEKLKMRKVIIEVMVQLGRDNPKVFAPFLSDPRWYLVRNVVLILSLLESPAALEMIVGLITHREVRIRKEVLNFLERSKDPKAKAYLLKFLRDEASALRIRALQLLSREGQGFALRSVIALTTSDDFRSRELAERKAVYEAIGQLGSASVLPLFRDMLLKKSWFKKAADRETALCALAGLMKIRGRGVLELLLEARKQQSPEVQGMMDQAIAALGGGEQRAATGFGGAA